MAMKQYESGETVNVVRGRDKGKRGVVANMDETTGEVTIIDENTEREITVANGTLVRVSLKKEAQEKAVAEIVAAKEPEEEDLVSDEEIRASGGTVRYVGGLRIEGGERTPAANVKLCECGCGRVTNRLSATKFRQFRSGHDQTHKGNLIRAMQAGSEDAKTELLTRKWRNENDILQLMKKTRNEQIDLSGVL